MRNDNSIAKVAKSVKENDIIQNYQTECQLLICIQNTNYKSLNIMKIDETAFTALLFSIDSFLLFSFDK